MSDLEPDKAIAACDIRINELSSTTTTEGLAVLEIFREFQAFVKEVKVLRARLSPHWVPPSTKILSSLNRGRV